MFLAAMQSLAGRLPRLTPRGALVLGVALGLLVFLYLRFLQPPQAGWPAFSRAVVALEAGDDRAAVAAAFRRVALYYPFSGYARDARELGELLEQMTAEDSAWREPPDPSSLSETDRIAYFVYHLRDVNCYQHTQPGRCRVLSPEDHAGSGEPSNAAVELRRIGSPAIPALIELLRDRRPIRSVGFWRAYAPHRTVLRYQDAAIEILDDLLGQGFYQRRSTASYLSTEREESREAVIATVTKWYEDNRDRVIQSPK
jgi:hypothetical protein